MKPRRLMLCAAVLAALLAPGVRAAMTAVAELGLQVVDGFRVTLFAGPELADDIQAMTFDARGRVIVTGPGYIKTLMDADGDGRAERAVLYAPTRTGGQGLCADGHHLMFVGDGYLSRFTDGDGDGIADGPPEHLLPLHSSEHGGHALRKGPDGTWLVIAGDDGRLPPGMINRLTSPVLDPSGGVLLRLSRTSGSVEVLAHGLRNPYDFDFDPLGGMFTADADAERDFLLPGYVSARLFHLALGGHHGWIATGGGRGWSRPEYALDRVPPLHRLGRGSPTGLEYYRHTQFPREFRDGLFVCDWTFGSVLFFPLRAGETSYSTDAEPFLRATGTNGFTPTDVCVGPDGSLFVSTGGRRTRGSVYRIEFNATDRMSSRSSPIPNRLDEILTAPQPLAAWSRARWEPAARDLGPEPFRSIVTDEGQPLERRIRAVEILTEHFGGLETARARVAARSKFPLVRARAAWSVGRVPCDDVASVLAPLTRDSFSLVRLRALEALLEQHPLIEPPVLLDLIAPALGDRDLRIRQLAARLAARLPETEWRALLAGLERASPQSRLTGALACLERPPSGAHVATATRHALLVLETLRQEDWLLQALRLLVAVQGEPNLAGEPVEAPSRSDRAGETGTNIDLPRRIHAALGAIFPSEDVRVNLEAARLLSTLTAPPAPLTATVAQLAANERDPARGLHFLSALARLNGAWDDEQPAQIATALLTLNSALAEAWMRPRLAWPAHLPELTRRLIRQEPRLARALLEQTNFVSPEHLGLTQILPPVQRRHAAHLFARAAAGDGFGWSPVLADLVADLPPESSFPYFRKHWNDPAARDAIALILARAPAEEDRFRFLDALHSTNTAAMTASLRALAALAPSDQTAQIEALFRLLERTRTGGADPQLASEVAALLSRSIGRDAPTTALRDGPEALLAWCRGRYPSLAEAVAQPTPEPGETGRAPTPTPGDAARGAQFFQKLHCAACHSGEHPAVVDLHGVSDRFPNDALLTAALKRPGHGGSRPSGLARFRARNGQVHEGLLAFESAEVVLLRAAGGQTVRLPGEDLTPVDPAGRNLAPDALVESLSPAELQDLLSHLRSL